MITVVNEVHQVEERVSSKLQNALAEFSREECILFEIVLKVVLCYFIFLLDCCSALNLQQNNETSIQWSGGQNAIMCIGKISTSDVFCLQNQI